MFHISLEKKIFVKLNFKYKNKVTNFLWLHLSITVLQFLFKNPVNERFRSKKHFIKYFPLPNSKLNKQ